MAAKGLFVSSTRLDPTSIYIRDAAAPTKLKLGKGKK
jgi:hypothetical protein